MDKTIVFVRYYVPGSNKQYRRGSITYSFSSGVWTPMVVDDDALYFARKATKNEHWIISLDGVKALDDDRTQYVYDRLVGCEPIEHSIVDEIIVEAEKPKPKPKKKNGSKKSTKNTKKKDIKKDGE